MNLKDLKAYCKMRKTMQEHFEKVIDALCDNKKMQEFEEENETEFEDSYVSPGMGTHGFSVESFDMGEEIMLLKENEVNLCIVADRLEGRDMVLPLYVFLEPTKKNVDKSLNFLYLRAVSLPEQANCPFSPDPLKFSK